MENDDIIRTDIVNLNNKSRKGQYVRTYLKNKAGKKYTRYQKYNGGNQWEYSRLPKHGKLKVTTNKKVFDYLPKGRMKQEVNFSWKDIITHERQNKIYDKLFSTKVLDASIRHTIIENIMLFRDKLIITENIYGNINGKDTLIASNLATRKTLDELKTHHRYSGTRIGDRITATELHTTIPQYYRTKNMSFIPKYTSTIEGSITIKDIKFVMKFVK